MDDKERDRRFSAERRNQARRFIVIQRGTMGEIERLLAEATKIIERELADQPSDFQAWRLPRLRMAIRQALEELGLDGGEALQRAAQSAWSAGFELIDRPIEAGGIRIEAAFDSIDTAQLRAMETFLTGRMRDVAARLVNRINAELAYVVIGTNTPGEAVDAITKILDDGGRARALTIVRTEIGGAYSAAAHLRQQQAAQILPGLRKQWRRSGKIHSRIHHDAADGQIQPVDKPFIVGGVPIPYPRDPSIPVEERVNCGCVSLPIMERWTVGQSGKQPFSDREISLSRQKRDLASGIQAA